MGKPQYRTNHGLARHQRRRFRTQGAGPPSPPGSSAAGSSALYLKLVEKAINRTAGSSLPGALSVSIIGVVLNIILIPRSSGYFRRPYHQLRGAALAGCRPRHRHGVGGLLALCSRGVPAGAAPCQGGRLRQCGRCGRHGERVGLFGTTIVSGDSVTHVVGNNKIFSDTIKNFFFHAAAATVDCVVAGQRRRYQRCSETIESGLARHQERARWTHRRRSKSSSSPPKARCLPCAVTPTPTTTGRSTSTSIKPLLTNSARPVIGAGDAQVQRQV